MKMDFNTQEGKNKATEIVKEIFGDFEKTETAFTEYGTIEVTANDVFEFSFRTDELLQLKRVIALLELKKLDRLVRDCGERE